jgi:hypothetical protein
MVILAWPSRADATGTWFALSNTAPDSVGLMLLLSDGTVMAANNPANTSGGIGRDWYRLTPDAFGHYVNGTWTHLATMNARRFGYASQVLTNGQVFVAGGEYPSITATTATAEIYDPVTNGWRLISPPASLLDPTKQTPVFASPLNQGFYDCESALRPDGTVLIAPLGPGTNRGTLLYNPAANNWSQGPLLFANNDEESWVKLPDDSILTVENNSTISQRYVPALNTWLRDANVAVSLWANLGANYGGEIGPAFLLPNGKAFFLGGSGHTAIYTPSGSTNNGSWIAGPDIPGGLGSADASAAMMPNGRILCAVAVPPSLDTNGIAQFPSPTSFYEYDFATGPKGTFTQVSGPTGTTDDIPSYESNLLALPDGSLLYCHFKLGNASYSSFGSQLYVYVPDGQQVAVGKPVINAITPKPDGSFHLTGTGLNGISEGAAYGDDCQMSGNYPIVQLKDINTGHMIYCRTYNWTSTGVQTGTNVISTEFTVPAGLTPETYWLSVTANGLASDFVPFSNDLRITVAISGNNLNLTWTDTNATLQRATDLTGPWTVIPTAASPYPVSPTNDKAFYRLLP